MDEILEQSLADIVAQCLDQVDQGASVEDCCARYPDHSTELRQMLGVATRVAALPPIMMPAAARIAIEVRMLREVSLQAQNPAAPQSTHLLRIPRLWMLIAVATLIAIIILILVTHLFSNNDQPYPVPLPSVTRILTTTRTPSPDGRSTPAPSILPVRTPAPTNEAIHPAPTDLPTPTSAPAAPGGGGGSGSPPENNCQGKETGRDDKKCKRDKDDNKEKDEKEKDD